MRRADTRPVKPAAAQSEPDEAVLRRAITGATHAPSVWNSQPWQWRAASRRGVDLFADRPRQQMATDPLGHDVLISCGAALHHFVIALADEGWSGQISRLPDPENRHHLAHIDGWTATSPGDTARLAKAIPRRHTDRRRFTARAVTPEMLADLVSAAEAWGAVLKVVEAPHARGRLIDAIADSAILQQREAGYASERARWTSRYAGSRDGIPPGSTIADPIGRSGDVPMRPSPHGRLAQSSRRGEHDDASVLMVLSTEDDGRLAVLQAGEATSAVLLTATALGLAATPLSQPLEVAETRAVIRNYIVGPTYHPQLVLRVGWTDAAALTPTPRRSLDRVLVWSDPVPAPEETPENGPPTDRRGPGNAPKDRE